MKYLLHNQESERLSYRLVEENDYEIWLESFIKIEGTTKYLALEHIGNYDDQCRSWFDRIFHRYQNDLGGMNVLIDKNNGALIGMAGLLIQKVDEINELEIGYSILPEFWGKGYASEAAMKCKEYAFLNNFSDSLISIVHIDNHASAKVAVKNGMMKEKQTFFKEMPVNIFRIYKI